MDRVSATALIEEAAKRLGWTTEVLDEYGYLYEIRAGERTKVMLGGRSALNDAVASRLAEDKHYAATLMTRAGLRVPKMVRCLSPTHPSLHKYRDRAGVDPADALAEELGYPLVVKPNRLSHGRGVTLAPDRASMLAAIENAWSLDAIALVQETISGRDYRLDFLDGDYLMGYERRPIVIRGDGRSTLAELLFALDSRFVGAGLLKLFGVERIASELAARGWTETSVLPQDDTLDLESPIKNLHAGCTAAYVPEISDALRAHCVRAADALGLRHFGVDLKIGSLDTDPNDAVFIEINASPLLTQIAKIGHAEEAIRAQMRVLSALLGAR